MRVRNSCILLCAALLAAACSTTRRLGTDEVLYTGVRKIRIEPDSGVVLSAAAESAVKEPLSVAPNNPLYSPYLRTPLPIGLWVYNYLYTPKEKGFKYWLYKRLAKQPVLISKVQPGLRTKVAEQVLENYGYFGSQAEDSLLYRKHGRKAKVYYTLRIAPPWYYSNISYPQAGGGLQPLIDSMRATSLLRVGAQYNMDSLTLERKRISQLLRNRGYYYFRPEYMEYLADTTVERRRVDLRLNLKPNVPEVALKPYRVGDITVRLTNPTLPFGINSQAELFDMIMVCHNLNPKIPSDVAFAESRVRPETQAAENVLHDLGVLSMVSSDSQAMGRIGESFLRSFQMASFMKGAVGKLQEDADGNDNFRVLRYLAKITINPAITFGVSDYLGSIAKGKIADLVLWEPQFFGTKPKLVIKNGLINWANMGDPNASLPTPQPCYYRPMFGAFGRELPRTGISFVSNAAWQSGIKERLRLERHVLPVRRTRQLTKYDMVRNGGMPRIDVNPETFDVLVNGVRAYVKPAREFPLSQLYFFS